MRYRDKNGRFISEKEYLRRKRISQALTKKKSEPTPEQLMYEQLLKLAEKDEKREKPKTKKSKTRTSKISTARTRAKNIKQTNGKSKKGNAKLSRTYTEKRKQTKVKTFPTKASPQNFFYTDKKQFILRRSINVIEDNQAMEKIEQFLKDILKSLSSFYHMTLKKNAKKKNKRIRMNLGYYILLDFISKDGDEHTRFETVSFLEPVIITKAPKSKSVEEYFWSKLLILFDEIKNRFVIDPKNSYIANQALWEFLFKGFEAEMELI